MLSSDWGDFVESSPGGCTHVRMVVPGQAMAEQGVEVHLGEYGWRDDEGFVVANTIERITRNQGTRGPILNPGVYAGDIDVIIFKLWMWHEYKEYIQKAQDMGQTIIIDIDDWFDGLPPDNIAFESTHPKRDAMWNRNHMISSFKYANGLITSTQFLTDFYRTHNKNIIQVRNSINPRQFIRRVDVGKDRPLVGWVGMMLWRKHDIEELRPWLSNFLEKNDLRFYHAGVNQNNPNEFPDIAGINPDRYSGVNGCSAKNYGNILLPMDIGIVPLQKVSFNEAKSSLKGMEYAMTGIPFVATDTEEYKLIASEGAGMVVRKPKDWMRAMESLLDPAVRKEKSEAGYQVVMEKYNIDIVVNQWIDAIEQIKLRNPKARGSK